MKTMKRNLIYLVIGLAALLGVSAWRLSAQQTKPEAPATYIGAISADGSATCMCHAQPEHKSWATTKHAKAFELLKMAGHEKDEQCLPCHTTGYGKGGYGTPGVTANLEGVQCEACHGPGSVHAATMDKSKITRVPLATVCSGCHQEMDIHASK